MVNVIFVLFIMVISVMTAGIVLGKRKTDYDMRFEDDEQEQYLSNYVLNRSKRWSKK